MTSGGARQGAGRKKGEESVHLHILIPKTLSEQISAHGERKTKIVIEALTKYLESARYEN